MKPLEVAPLSSAGWEVGDWGGEVWSERAGLSVRDDTVAAVDGRGDGGMTCTCTLEWGWWEGEACMWEAIRASPSSSSSSL